jgi:hypothetical protein
MPIIARSDWSDIRPTWTSLALPTPKAVLHHQGGGGPKATTLDQLKAWLRGIEHSEMSRGDGLIALAYHWFVINGGPFDGYVFESRPMGKQGGATRGQNGVSHAVCVSGDFTYDKLTPKAFDVTTFLFAEAQKQGFVVKGTPATPHSLYSATACPGNNLRDALPLINARVHDLVYGPPIDWEALHRLVLWAERVRAYPLRKGQSHEDVSTLKALLAWKDKKYDVGNRRPVYGARLVDKVHLFKQDHPEIGNTNGRNAGPGVVRALGL